MMKVVSAEKMRWIDAETISRFGIPGHVLMERAGKGVAETIKTLADYTGRNGSDVLLFAGTGNNGGDAYVCARHLKRMGFLPRVCLAGRRTKVKGDAWKHLELMVSTGIQLEEAYDESSAEEFFSSVDFCRGFIVDALLGTGVKGAPREPMAGIIRRINLMASDSLVVAVDIPSGLDADTGETEGEAVKADVTTTMALPKLGMVAENAIEYTGPVNVIDIGVPGDLIAGVESEIELITAGDVARLFPGRRRNAHKGDFGHVLIIAGSAGFSGAPILSAGGAVRSGAGLVTVLTPGVCAAPVAARVPEAMVHSATGDAFSRLNRRSLDCLNRGLEDFDAILAGAWLGTGKNIEDILSRLFSECNCPLILDADALNTCALRPDMLAGAESRLAMTPHPGEMGRLLSCSAANVQKDRLKAAVSAAEKFNAVVALKGAGTIVASTGRVPAINTTGNPGMASGGTGDVLAGLAAGFAAQGMDVHDALCGAVHIHGHAGDIAAWRFSQPGLSATELMEDIPSAFASFSVR